MKLLLILSCILAALTLVTADQSLPEQGIFSDLFANFSMEIDEIPDVFLTKDEIAELKTKIPCVMNKIDYDSNKNKIIEEVTSTYLFVGAGAMCMSDQVTFWKNMADKLYTLAKNQETFRIEHIECLQWLFSRYQPSSRLLRNFNANLSPDEINTCRGTGEIDQIKNMVRYFDLMSGGFSELTCGSVSNKVAVELFLNVFLLTYEQDQTEVDHEMKRISDVIKQKCVIMVDCIKDNLSIDY